MDFSKIKEYLDGCIEKGLPCYDVYIQRDHEVLYHESNGFSDLERTLPINGNEMYWFYSATKPVTVSVAMSLVEKGLISLDDDVAKYIPEYANLTVKDADGNVRPATKPMKIHHLFSMSSGLTYDFGNPLVREGLDNNSTTLEVVRNFPKMPLAFEPGNEWCYGLSHDVLAAVVEVVTGKKYADYVDEVVFKPLGMKDATFHMTDEQKCRMAQKYDYRDGNVVPENGNIFVLSDVYECGGAGMCTTLDDYRKFADMMACGESADGYHLLSKESVDTLRENRFTDEQLRNYWKNNESGYGLGVYTLMNANDCGVPAGVFGWDGAAGAYLMVDVVNHISIVLCTHITNWVAILQHENVRDEAYKVIFNK